MFRILKASWLRVGHASATRRRSVRALSRTLATPVDSSESTVTNILNYSTLLGIAVGCS
jgi:hypothetical protein